jgi:ribonuclease Z
MQAIPIEGPQKSGAPEVVFDEDGLKITAFPVQHDPVVPAYGYRFDYEGRSLVVSGDTIKSASLIAAARGSDLLIHEAQSDEMVDTIGRIATRIGRSRVATIMKDIQTYHTTPLQAAEAANEAQVKLLVMYHLNPPPPVHLVERLFARGVDEVRAEGWILADDGTLITLPAGSALIELEQL